MDTPHDQSRQQPTPLYQTPTTTAARVLEDMVAQRSSSQGSQSSTHSSHDTFEQAATAPSPLPALPPQPSGTGQPTPSHNSPPHMTPLPPVPPLSFNYTHMHTTSPPPDHTGLDSAHNDVRHHRTDTEPSSRKSKNKSRSLPRRILEELQHHDRHTECSSTSPTDSHPGRHRHSRSRSSSESISAMLVLTSERLVRETTRANEAERQASEILAMFKTMHEAKARLERDFNRVREELGLYKIQLDVAQKEIFRAQEIVDRVERQRVDAEDDASRTKDKMRKLMEVRAVEHAMEEGRRFGYEEGLRQGRILQAENEADARRKSGSRRRSNEEEDEPISEVSRYTYPKEGSQSSGSSIVVRHNKAPIPPETPIATSSQPPPLSMTHSRPRASSSAAPRRTRPPDVAPYPQMLPIPTITTPMPMNVPATQPPVVKPMPPHQPAEALHHHNAKPPEQIKIQPHDPNGQIHPIPYHNHSPSVSHRSIILPPDNYIPVIGPDSFISLPPPHELSIPVAPEAPPRQPPPPPPPQASEQRVPRPRSGSRGRDSAFHVVNQDPSERQSTHRHLSRTGAARAPPNPMSVRSRGSTHFSDLDMLSPPRDYREYMPNEGRSTTASRERAEGDRIAQSDGQSKVPVSLHPRPNSADAVAEQWRNANPEYIRAKSPPESYRSRRTAPRDPERPMSTEPSVYGKPSSLSGTRQIRTPRRPREVVLPVPLGEALPSMGAPNSSHRVDDAASHPLDQGRAPRSSYGRPTILTEISNATVPGIDIQTPSTHTPSGLSERTQVDPVLLTPESANRMPPLPDHYQSSEQREPTSLGLVFDPSASGIGAERIEMTLPNNQLPEGFVPLSPINGLENLNSYPPGFAPSMPKDHPGGSTPHYNYGTPLPRP